MKTVHLSINTNIEQDLFSRKIPHKISKSSQSTYIEVPQFGKKYYIGASGLKRRELSFISSVRRYAEGIGKPRLPFTSDDIRYLRFNERIPPEVTNIVEIDVNSAYWNIAYQEGYISKKLYEKGNDRKTISKRARLVALGSMASVRKEYEFDGNTMKFSGYLVNNVTRSYFFDIAKKLDDLMSDCFDNVNGYFYWVDAFFVPIEYGDFCYNYMEDNNLQCKFRIIDSMKKRKDENGFDVWDVYDGSKIRTFTPPCSLDYRRFLLNNHRNIVNKTQKKLKDD